MNEPEHTTGTARSGVPLQRLVMPQNAVALRPVRILKGGLREYTATTFPKAPREGCVMYYNRVRSCGGISDEAEPKGLCDVLDANGDIIADFPLTRQGLNLLVRWLDSRVEAEAA